MRALTIALVGMMSTLACAQLPDSCFKHVGCFKNGPPWTSPVRPIPPPQPPSQAVPFMYYYGRNMRNGKPFQVYPKPNLRRIPYSPKKETFVLVHGFTDNAKLPWLLRLKDVILNKTDANVFIPDYSRGSSGSYQQAAANIRVYGKIYALTFKKAGISGAKMHLIGHSLGGHLSSYICKELNAMGERVGWLTGLDVATPLFEIYPNVTRFDVSDADFVDVHHSNAGVRGYVYPHGHIDVYYNGGTRQPRCELYNEYANIQKYLIQYGTSSCYHHMCHEYYVSSVENGCIYGLPASMKPKLDLLTSTVKRKKLVKTLEHSCYPHSCLKIGFGMRDSPLRGIFSVKTQDYPPYCSKILPLTS